MLSMHPPLCLDVASSMNPVVMRDVLLLHCQQGGELVALGSNLDYFSVKICYLVSQSENQLALMDF